TDAPVRQPKENADGRECAAGGAGHVIFHSARDFGDECRPACKVQSGVGSDLSFVASLAEHAANLRQPVAAGAIIGDIRPGFNEDHSEFPVLAGKEFIAGGEYWRRCRNGLGKLEKSVWIVAA